MLSKKVREFFQLTAALAMLAACGSREINVHTPKNDDALKRLSTMEMQNVRINLLYDKGSATHFTSSFLADTNSPMAIKYDIAKCDSGYTLSAQTSGEVAIPKADLDSCEILLSSIIIGTNEYISQAKLSHKSTSSAEFTLQNSASKLSVTSAMQGSLTSNVTFKYSEITISDGTNAGISSNIGLTISGVEAPYIALSPRTNLGYSLTFKSKVLSEIGKTQSALEISCSEGATPAAFPLGQCSQGTKGCFYWNSSWYAAPSCQSSRDSHAIHKNALRFVIIRQGDEDGEISATPTYAKVHSIFPDTSSSVFNNLGVATDPAWPSINLAKITSIPVIGKATTSNDLVTPTGLKFWLVAQYYTQTTQNQQGPSYKLFEVLLKQ